VRAPAGNLLGEGDDLSDMRVAIIGDTHVPSRAEGIPGWVREEVDRADRTIHTGDFDSERAYDEVVAMTDDLTAVEGNMDPSSLDLPEVATLDVERVRFVVTHGTGDLERYEARVAETVAEHAADDRTTIGISGHTHQRMDQVRAGHRLLNPGSATGASPAPDTSMMVAEVDGSTVEIETTVE